MSSEFPVPETRVLAIASHVVSGNVGNKIAVFTLQSLGCDVAALNTVQFSNHTGYHQWTGSKVSAEEISSLYDGLKQSYLDDFDMMLSGYIPGAEAVSAVGRIGEDLREKSLAGSSSPGGFFWVLDPVMGDNGRLYVAEEVVPAYQALIEHADLILPNQFEAEVLSGVKIVDMDTLKEAIEMLHRRYRIPHVIITSVSLPTSDLPPQHLSVVGSTMTSDFRPRLFKIVFPAIDCYFSGTGDMFAALMTARMRQAIWEEPSDLRTRRSWLSGDEADVLSLPLVRAVERVLGSMHEVLTKTAEAMAVAVEKTKATTAAALVDGGEESKKKAHLLTSKNAELRLVRNVASLRNPEVVFKAKAI
ncbi:pyridoxal kinase [Sodiomyces alkalinus F11]|uniref:pyridoxal kinase n=1 Tax=Sodiomyces alkalinus (strain CBS 110278 / VKM F-3762 / F11) TaxID=1314773 RepID=A0A3N2PS25_SODAK|nr:pyridoxal kinase [Sodiomyces alkalinus F11]ROT37319.1 pyridoxal kinase [Sodiomyces alkalinus F11]